MIISASRRSDIPAFYADWFMTRVREGFFHRVNPFNSKQISGFSLKPEDVDAVCFWSKNPRPMIKDLDELDRRGLNYYFQFTLNPYDKIFEPDLPPLQERIETMQELAARIGPERVIWRYDPVVLTSVTPVFWHLEMAERLAGELGNATRRLMFSFYDFYGKGRGRLHKHLSESGIRLDDITAAGHRAELEELAFGFKNMADRHALQIFTCSEDVGLERIGIKQGACIDGALIRQLFGVNATSKKDKNQRAACNCVESAEMGIYNSCRFNCAYCYANFNRSFTPGNGACHDPDSPMLLGRYEGKIEIRTSLKVRKKI